MLFQSGETVYCVVSVSPVPISNGTLTLLGETALISDPAGTVVPMTWH